MVDLQLLKERDIDYEGLKKLLAPDDKLSALKENEKPEKKGDKIQKLKQIIRSRISAGREQNISGYKHFHAIDLAWETPRRQVSTTLLQSLMDKTDSPAVRSTLEAWGFDLNTVLEEVIDGKTGKKIKRINQPAFTQVFVPLVKAYVSIRLAKLMNDRRKSPFFKYEPAISNALSRLQCEVLTSRVEMMNQHYDYWNTFKQATLQMLLYGVSYLFPKEEWHEECHETKEGDKLGRKVKKDKDSDPDKWERVDKEGLRYKTPHPSRVFADEAHPPSSYNTDTGCEYSGYWEVVRYRDVRNNTKFYNTDKVSIGATEWWARPSTQVFFATVYNGCTIAPPVISENTESDRETRMADNFYTQDSDDSSVMVTNYFQKLVPSEFGLGDYDYPVWFRFVVAADDTILYAAPLPYAPTIYLGYDADDLRASAASSSLALECLPFQDQVSNLMTQHLISVRQNLANVTFFDTAQIKAPWIEKLRNIGNSIFSRINWIPFDSKGKIMAQQDVAKAFQSFRFPALDTNGTIQSIKLTLDILERVLVMSSQEIAQAATHEQTREEIRGIQGSTSTRLTATGIPIDQAKDAAKKQLYLGLMSYGEDEIYAQIPIDRELTVDVKETLKGLGFTFEENDLGVVKSRRVNVTVTNKKKSLMLESFTSSRDGEDRINNTEAGTAMLQTLVGLMGSPLYPSIGPDQMLMLINVSAQIMGYPREFKLQNMGGSDQDMMGQMQQMLGQLQQAMRQEMQQGIIPIMDAIKTGQEESAKLTEKTEQTFDKQQHLIKDVAQESDSRQQDMEREQKNFREQLARILKAIEETPKLPGSTPIIAPNAQITVGGNGSDAARKGSQTPTVVTAA